MSSPSPTRRRSPWPSRRIAPLAVILILGLVLAVARGGADRVRSTRHGAGQASRSRGPAPLLAASGSDTASAGELDDAGGGDGLEASGDPTRALRLEGQVSDRGNHPVGGARVTAIVAGQRRVVMTEADGSFGFDDLAAGTYDVTAEHGGEYAESQKIRLDDTTDPVMLTLVRGPTLIVHVVDGQHQPIAGAAVEAPPRAFVTGADGTVRIRGVELDDVYVTIAAPGRGSVHGQVLTGDDPAATVEWTCVLGSAAEVSGIVVDDSGAPVTDAYIEIRRIGGYPGFLSTTGVFTDSLYLGDTAQWRVALGAGTYEMHGGSARHIQSPDITLELDGIHPRSGVILRVERGGEIAGTVVDGAGHPVAGARVSIGTKLTSTDADGRYTVSGLAPDSYRVVASTRTQGGASQPIELARGEEARVDLVVATSSLAGIVVDTRGQPVEGAQVFARSVATDRLSLEHSNEHGRFDFGGLPPGAYQVVALLEGSHVEGPPIDATTTDRRLRLTVPDPAEITGRVLLDGAPVTHFVVMAGDDRATTYDEPRLVLDAGGRFRLRRATPGRCVVIIVGPGLARHVVEGVLVTDGGVTDLGDIAVAPSAGGDAVDGGSGGTGGTGAE